jgi:beta-lactamase class A
VGTQRSGPARRAVLLAGAAGALAACAPGAPAGRTDERPPPAGPRQPPHVTRRLRELEREHGARLGVWARHTGTGATVAHRADERFPMCSTFKPLAAAAVLRDHGHDLADRVRHRRADLVPHSPVTGTAERLENGTPLEDLCEAAVRHSDNTAANLLLRHLGGPGAVTRFCRSLGDRVTRLDRTEPDLNSGGPGSEEDTTSPAALARTYERLLLGDALGRRHRALLLGWMRTNTTNRDSFRAGLPGDWAVADKTGTGGHGTHNDIGVAYPPSGPPLLMAVFTTKPERDAAPDHALVATTAALLARTLS